MTSSGLYTFSQSRDQIITRALRQLGAYAAGETPDAQTVADAAVALNAMVKEWEAIGLHVWLEDEAILFLQPNQVQYGLGGINTDNCTGSTTWIQQTVATILNGGSADVPVTSSAGMLAGDYFGVTLDSGPIFWSTISLIVGNTVTMADVLPSSAQAANLVFDYTTKIQRPLRVPRAARFIYASGGGQAEETPMIVMSRKDYMNLPNKTDTGTITQFFYAPYIGPSQQGPGLMYVWPAPSDATSAMRFTWMSSIQDFATAADTANFPQEWTNALTWNLAEEMGPEYDVPTERMQIIAGKAAKSLDRVTGWDREPEPYYFGVDFQQGG